MNYKNLTKELVSDTAFKNLEIYVDMIEEQNKVMNLTGFKGDRLWQEGIYESIFILKNSFKETNDKKILDIGAGAGFPSIPYLIAFPNNELTIMEPQRKRVLFLEKVVKELNLNVTIEVSRAEDSDASERFDYVTARAVASFKIMAEISHKMAKIDAVFAFIKGPKINEEIESSSWIMKELDINVELLEFDIEGKKTIVARYLKTKKTPKTFPRKWMEIVKK